MASLGFPGPGHEAEQTEIETTGSKALELFRIMNQTCLAVRLLEKLWRPSIFGTTFGSRDPRL